MDLTAFQEVLAGRAAAVERELDRLIQRRPGAEDRLFEAMRYAALGGGKRLRAFLAIESAALFDGVSEAQALRTAAAAECVHAYSLIHDDLPCMDDDDLRRGRPTAHIAFDEATAVLAGDALQTLAFEILSAPETAADPAIRIALVARLARASGGDGMVGGQMIDIMAEIMAEETGAALDLAEVARLQSLKTGALIAFSAASGALLAGADPAPLERYAAALGAAFQIRDDLLDVEGDEEEAGKRLRKDADKGKATFLGLLGVAAATERAHDLVAEAKRALAPYGDRAAALAAAADFALARKS